MLLSLNLKEECSCCATS